MNVALSSMEEEYQAMSSAAQKVMYYREIGFKQDSPTIVQYTANDLLVSTKNHPRVKHVPLYKTVCQGRKDDCAVCVDG